MFISAFAACFVFSKYENLGQLTVSVSLENWGPMNDVTPTSAVSQSRAVAAASSSDVNTASSAGAVASAPAVTAPEARETQEYAAALELEVWKEQQEAMFASKVHILGCDAMSDTVTTQWPISFNRFVYLDAY